MQFPEEFKKLVSYSFDGYELKYLLEYLEDGDLERFEYYLKRHLGTFSPEYIVKQIDGGIDDILNLREKCKQSIKAQKVWSEYQKYMSSQNIQEHNTPRR